MATTVLKEFLISLGYRIDESSQRKFEDSLFAMSATVEKLGLGLAALAAGFISALDKMAGKSSEMAYLADYIGSTVKDFHALAFAGTQVGISAEHMMQSIRGVGLALKDNIPAQAAWASLLGGDTSGTMGEQLARLGQRLAAEGPNSPTRKALVDFAQKFSIPLDPELLRGIQNPKFPEAVRHGQRIEEEFPGASQFSAKSQAYEAAIGRLQILFERLGQTAGNVTVDHVTNGLNIINDWIEAHHDSINEFFNKFGVNLKDLGPGFDVVVGGFAALVKELGGLDTVIKLLEGGLLIKFLLGGTLTSIFRGVGAAVGGLATAADLLATALGALASVPGLALLLSLLPNTSIQSDKDEKKLLERLRAEGPNQTAHGPRSDDPPVPTEQTSRPPISVTGTAGSALKTFWEWLIPSAQGSEVTPQLKILNQNLDELNQSLDKHGSAFSGWTSGVVGEATYNMTGFTGTGPKSGGGTGSKQIDWKNPRVLEAMQYFMGHGYSMQDSSAIVANLWAESGLDPAATNSQGNQGVAQWDRSRRERFRGIYGHLPAQGTSAEQFAFIDLELHTSHRKALEEMLAAPDIASKARVVDHRFEGSEGFTTEKRASDAVALGSHITPSIMSNIQTNNSADKAVHNEQHIVNNVHGMRDADEAAKTLKDVQQRHWADMMRNVTNPVY